MQRLARRSKPLVEVWKSADDRWRPEHRKDQGTPGPDPLHVRDARGVPPGCLRRDPRDQPGYRQELLRADAGNDVGDDVDVHGRGHGAALDLLPGHHALHQCVDHSPAPDGGDTQARAAQEGRGAGAQEDQSVHALLNRWPVPFPELPDRGGSGKWTVRSGCGAGARLGLSADVHDHTHDRDLLHHVAR